MTSYLYIIIAVGGCFGFMYFMKRRLNTQYSHLRAGELAGKLGMQLLEGNPEHNLATMSVQPSVQNTSSAKGFLKQVATTQFGGQLGELKIRMAGQPYGANAELMLYCRQDYKPGFTENVTTTWSDLRLTVHARCNVAPFDLRLRDEHVGLESHRDDDAPRMPAQQFGDAALDRRFTIECYDPALPRYLAGVLGVFATVMPYVHVTAQHNQVSFVMTPSSVNASASSLEQILHALVSIAAMFEGRPVPGALIQPAMAHA